jgi:DNA recombination protein RmuC
VPLTTALLVAALAAVVAAVVGVLLARLAGRREVHTVGLELASIHSRAERAEDALAAAHAENRQHVEALSTVRAENAGLARDRQWLSEEIKRHKASLGETQALIEQADKKFKETFQSVAAEALNANRTAFLDLAKVSFEGFSRETKLQSEARHKALDSLVKPITDTLQTVGLRLGEAERQRLETYSRLSEQVATLGAATSQLSKALRTPAVRGRWGEMQLRRVVEIAGMLNRCDFEEQPTLQGDGGRLRPDLVVHLPGGKRIVVDAKAPLNAYLDAQEAESDDARVTKLRLHARHVRDHMDNLGSKAYWQQLDHTPDMVVMFLPGETLFSAALQNDVTLIEHGLSRRVLLASPITLIAMLTTIAHGWRQEALADNYREVARLGSDLHDRLATFVGHFDDVRRRLDSAVQAYNHAAGSFESRVLVGARRLKELKVTAGNDLPSTAPIDTTPRRLRHTEQMDLPEVAPGSGEPEAAPDADSTEPDAVSSSDTVTRHLG